MPDICESSQDCNLIYYQTEIVEKFSFPTESILKFKSDSIFVVSNIINPRNTIINQEFIIVKDKYYITNHNLKSPGLEDMNFKLDKIDYIKTKQFPTRILEAKAYGSNSFSVVIESTNIRLFDTLYNKKPKRAIEISGICDYSGFSKLDKAFFKETMVAGIGTTSYIETNDKDTISHTVLDSVVLVDRKDLKTFP